MQYRILTCIQWNVKLLLIVFFKRFCVMHDFLLFYVKLIPFHDYLFREHVKVNVLQSFGLSDKRRSAIVHQHLTSLNILLDLLLYTLLPVLLIYFSINLSRILLLTCLKPTFDLVRPPSGKLWLSLPHFLFPNLLLISIFILIIVLLFIVENHPI